MEARQHEVSLIAQSFLSLLSISPERENAIQELLGKMDMGTWWIMNDLDHDDEDEAEVDLMLEEENAELDDYVTDVLALPVEDSASDPLSAWEDII
jgi:hypothetical protein